MILEQSIETGKQLFETVAVFCATSDYQNLLMWAHYADKHRGVVIGLKPDLEKDSVLTQIRPVKYTEQRPNLLDPAHQQRHQSSEEWAMEAFHRILHTKSPEWAYEKEYRLAMPYAVKPGEKEWLLNLHPKEVVELYLGYRLDSPSKERLITLAKQLNPEVRIFQAYTEKRSYNLRFLPI